MIDMGQTKPNTTNLEIARGDPMLFAVLSASVSFPRQDILAYTFWLQQQLAADRAAGRPPGDGSERRIA